MYPEALEKLKNAPAIGTRYPIKAKYSDYVRFIEIFAYTLTINSEKDAEVGVSYKWTDTGSQYHTDYDHFFNRVVSNN